MQPLGLVVCPFDHAPLTAGKAEVAHSALDPTLVATASADRRFGWASHAEVENLPDRTVKIWDVKQQRPLWTLSGHKDTGASTRHPTLLTLRGSRHRRRMV